MLQPIQTNYAGCLFRSRLEARWAVFFDAAGIKWLYEPEGFTIKGFQDPSGVGSEQWNYLPDFLLPDFRTWVEVKGDLNDVTDDYLQMIQWCVDFNGCLPNMSDSAGTTAGLLFLSNIPEPNEFEICHPILQHHKGGWINLIAFTSTGIKFHYHKDDYFDASWGDGGCIRNALADLQNYQGIYPIDPSIYSAYLKARKARFEHGECGR